MQLQLTQSPSQSPRKRTCFSFFCDLCEHEHAKNDCVLVGMRILRAQYPTPCEICKQKFYTVDQALKDGERRKHADAITIFGDLGYVHTACLVPLLRLERELDAVPLPERVQRLANNVPVSVAKLFVRLTIGDLSSVRVRIINAVPGAGKSWLLVLLYSLAGIRRSICLTFNTGACVDMRERDATNTFTYNALGMRAGQSGVVGSIKVDKAAGLYTILEAPLGLTLSLVKGCKVTILLHHLYPPVRTAAADGVAARMSIHVRVCGDFLGELYPLALANAFGAVVEDHLPAMEDVGSLMGLALQMKTSRTLEQSFATLTPAGQARWAAICNGSTPAARLAYACALLQPVHEASLETTTRATWTLPSGQKLLYIQGPGVKDSAYKLPATCFAMQTSLKLYRPDLVKVVSGTYSDVLGDESQDGTKARELFLREVVKQSDINGGPGHNTTLTIVGDDDQAITGWSGGLPDPFASARLTFGVLGEIAEPDLLCSLRVPELLADYAVENYKQAYSPTGYAHKVAALAFASPRAEMTAAPNAILGILETNINFHVYPLLALAELGKVIIAARRHTTLAVLYDLLVVRGIPCCYVKIGDELEMPLTPLLNAVDLVTGRLYQLELELTATNFLETLPVVVGGPILGCLRLCVRRTFHPPLLNDGMQIEVFKGLLTERFSPNVCHRIELMTGHGTKGKTTRTLIKVQPNDFPLKRCIEDGGIYLLQEPRVGYVTESRQTHVLLEATNSTGNEDHDLEATLFPEDVSLATELPFAIAHQDEHELQRSREHALAPGYVSGIVTPAVAARLVADALVAASDDAAAQEEEAPELGEGRCDVCGHTALLHPSPAGDDVCDACAEAAEA